ncbi:peptide MFS transporter [Paraglaciecola aquimarina]|uniref:Peptide MFS transporter n=1 Tax=Paraglaciecola aquimarina TaxID=1235557 RepID=A0ABU3T1Q6_9ALTE|nr:peptide MFS transporter [Paraglaciecola aquimarina]MDU0356127.1 peptide MFS transporter [Paraglaciecola aquimarina]
MTTESTNNDLDTGFFGHPKGLSTLFFTEMWERFSYYGMRALLVLFMTASIQEGGLFITVASASAIYGLYTGSVYLMGLPGGWIADRLLGCQRTVWYGGLIIFAGHLVLAIPNDSTFFVGLVLVVLGTGLLKPNIGAMVGQLYGKTDNRRDAGYTLYYMGINIGSFLAYLTVGPLKEQGLWHWAFGLAALGMAIGLIQYRKTIYKLGDAGAKPSVQSSPTMIRTSWTVIGAFLVALTVIVGLIMAGSIVVDPVATAEYAAVIITAIFLAYFAGVFFFGNLSNNEKRSLSALFLVCLASAVFWAGFEQAGSSLNLFAQDYTNRLIGSFEIPTIWFQLSNSAFIITLSPFIAALWINLAKKMITPSYGIKCALGLIIMASGFLVMFFAAQYAAAGLKVAPYWLVATYFLHTVGELCLSPVALSAVSKLSPKRFAGQMMGVFVLTYSIGNVVAGLLAGNFDPNNLDQMPELFMQICIVSAGVGVVVAVFTLKTKKWEKLAD